MMHGCQWPHATSEVRPRNMQSNLTATHCSTVTCVSIRCSQMARRCLGGHLVHASAPPKNIRPAGGMLFNRGDGPQKYRNGVERPSRTRQVEPLRRAVRYLLAVEDVQKQSTHCRSGSQRCIRRRPLARFPLR